MNRALDMPLSRSIKLSVSAWYCVYTTKAPSNWEWQMYILDDAYLKVILGLVAMRPVSMFFFIWNMVDLI